MIPTLEPKVCKYDLPWAIWRPWAGKERLRSRPLSTENRPGDLKNHWLCRALAKFEKMRGGLVLLLCFRLRILEAVRSHAGDFSSS